LRFRVFIAALLSSLTAASLAGAAPVTLRIATAAPDGTAWARVFRVMARELEEESHGEVKSKLYFGGIAGDEMQSLDRMQRGQLDAILSGGMACIRLSPSMRALRMLGLFQSRDESSYVLGRLRPTIDAEFIEHGARHIGSVGLGSDMIFSRTPVHSLADLQKLRVWVWDLDETMRAELKAFGVTPVPLPLDQAAHAFETGAIDAFLAVPTAALAFQWSAQARYLSDLRLGYLPGCMVISTRAFDQLSVDGRKAFVTATAKAQARLEALGREQDELLLNGLLQKQGVQRTPVSATFNSEFFTAAHAAREQLADKLVPRALLDKVTEWLADYRAANPRK
jgi:TRAP-type C4-dicarboxylate transport system substrate-binding protein